jgi:hypothetical protein
MTVFRYVVLKLWNRIFKDPKINFIFCYIDSVNQLSFLGCQLIFMSNLLTNDLMRKFCFIILTILGAHGVFASNDDTTVFFKQKSISEDAINSMHQQIIDVLKINYPDIKEYLGFELAISDYVTEKTTGKRNLENFDLPDFMYSLNYDYILSNETLKEVTQERIDYLKSTGLPIAPDRFLVRTIEQDGQMFTVVALDETYIAPTLKD